MYYLSDDFRNRRVLSGALYVFKKFLHEIHLLW